MSISQVPALVYRPGNMTKKREANRTTKIKFFQFNFSPSTSLEAVGAPTAGQGTIPAPRQWVDSDDETCDNIADWSSNVAADILQTLSDGEKKRQEIINGRSEAYEEASEDF